MSKKQIAFRMNEDEYKELRIQLLKNGMTFQEYIEKLIKDDKENLNGGN